MATYYVAKNGNDSYLGTEAQPWLTISRATAYSSLIPGDIVYVRTGTYNEKVNIVGIAGTSGSRITIQNYAGEYPIIDGTGILTGSGSSLVRIFGAYITFTGFHLQNGDQAGVITTGIYTIVSHCTIHDMRENAVIMVQSAHYSITEYVIGYNLCLTNLNGILSGTGTSWGTGISAARYPDYCIIRHCTIHDVWGEGISTYEATNTIIEDNIVYDNYSVGIYVSDATDNLVQRNLIYQTKDMGNGSQVGYGHWNERATAPYINARNTFINNIAYGCNRNIYLSLAGIALCANNTAVNSAYFASVQLEGTSAGAYFANNIIIQEDGLLCIYALSGNGFVFRNNLYNKSYDSDAVGTGDIVSTLHIAKIGTIADVSYYQLVPTSPAINGGTDVNVDYDYLEVARGTTFDIGALEYTGVVSPNIYYIKTYASGGRDESSRTGYIGQEWATLAYACTRAITSGDIIHVITGTYNETLRANLALGVSIVGEGIGSWIRTTYVATNNDDGAIYLNSASGQPVNGNQSISYIKLDGTSLASTRGIAVNFRNSVEVHHCTIIDFAHVGIRFNGNNNSYPLGPSVTYSSNNKVYNCIINNCSTRSGSEAGSVVIEGQLDCLMYNNTFDQRSRTAGQNGNIITSNWTKGWKVHDNTFTKYYSDGTEWNFFFESWHFEGGCDIYNNTFNGGAVTDISDVRKGSYTYGLTIHDNDFLMTAQNIKLYHNADAITVECWGMYEYLYIFNNYFKNQPCGVWMVAPIDMITTIRHIYIYNNIFENIGYTDYATSYAIFVNSETAAFAITYDNVHIWNNTILSGTTYPASIGIRWQAAGEATNVTIRNNIIRGFSSRSISFALQRAGASITTLSVENNLYYLNGTDAVYYDPSVSITNKTELNNNVGNPYFTSSIDFHLTSSSTLAIAEGINVGLSTDFDDVVWNNPPSIGTYEYTGTIPPPPPPGTIWYIDPLGSNTTGDGSIGSPWQTLAYACTRVTTAGHTIHVNSGTYNEGTIRSYLSVNVSIEGETNMTSNIIFNYQNVGTAEGQLQLVGGTNTAQHISNIRLDGDNLTGYQGIAVYARDNVEIRNCQISNFYMKGVMFAGAGSNDNSFHDNILTNCGGNYPATYAGSHWPNLQVTQQTRMLIYNNTITQTARANGNNGNGIAGYEGLTDSKIYNNTITVQPPNGLNWMFSIELWESINLEIYGNTINGEIDIAGNIENDGVYVHDNIIGWNTPHNIFNAGLQFENRGIENNIHIYNNLFKNCELPIYFCYYNDNSMYVDNINIYNNIIYNTGRSGTNVGYGIYFQTGPEELPVTFSDVNIWNNTIIANSVYPGQGGIFMPSGNTVTNISIRNNIIMGFTVAPIYENQTIYGSMNTLSVENNLFYNNGHSNTPYYVDWTPSNYTYQNNNIGNPNFADASTFDFHLTSESLLAIGEGINVGLLTDYDGENWNIPPSIGAYEYSGTLPSPPVTAFIASSVNILEGQSITFTDQSTNSPTSWSWNFGDGGTSILQNPTYIYTTAGTYTVSLTATNAYGQDIETKTNYITVSLIPSGDIVIRDALHTHFSVL